MSTTSTMNNNFQNFFFSVFIRCGRNFQSTKWLEGNAPYVEVTIGDETKKTNKLSNLNNPCWNETLKFELKDFKNIPPYIKFIVKDDRMLFASAELGEYIFDLDREKLLNYQMQKEMTPFCTLYDGLFNLKNSENGVLDVKILFACGDCNWLKDEERLFNNLDLNNTLNTNDQQIQFEEVRKNEYEKVPDIAFQKNEVEDIKMDEEYYKKLDQNEVHVLPTIYVQDKPKIIEKEVEYIKPVEVKETIIHKEKPIIIEQPTIKEKHEHYREIPKYEKNMEQIITESKHEQDVGNLDSQELQNLKEQRIKEFNDTTPIMEHEKNYVQLETDYREKPAEIREKEVVYQQPIEIEKTNIENIKPKVREDVLVEKEHINQKLAPEIQQENVQHIKEKDQFYSKETDKNLQISPSNQDNTKNNEVL